MDPRGRVAPVVASGTATAVKLLVATLAFAGAYVGVEASNDASVHARAGGSDTPVRTVTLASQVTRTTGTEIRKAPVRQHSTENGGVSRAARAGAVVVGVRPGGVECGKELLISGPIVNGEPRATVLYRWRLQRWSPTARKWKSYVTGSGGFTGPERVAEWRPDIGTPGWYRAQLSVDGARLVHSERIQLSC